MAFINSSKRFQNCIKAMQWLPQNKWQFETLCEQVINSKKKMQFRLFLLSVVVLFCAVEGEKLPWYRFRPWILDRSRHGNYVSPGYFTLPVDRTAFAVNDRVWLERFDIPKIYLCDPNDAIPVEDVKTHVKLVEIFKPNAYENVLFEEKVSLNSTDEAKIDIKNTSGEVVLRPGYVYEIRLEFPKDMNIMYDEFLHIKEFSMRKVFNTYIYVDFFQNNPVSKPPKEEDKTRKLTHGIVKKLHLKYKKF